MSIASRMKEYGVAGFADIDVYGQHKMPTRPTRFVVMDIEILNNSDSENPLYQDVEYIGLTKDTITRQDYVFYEDEILKVKFINTKGRYNQIFMAKAKANGQ